MNKNTIGGFILISLAYGPGVFRESFWSDDYPGLLDSQGVAKHILGDARPTLALLFSGSFGLLNSPSQAWILRSLALLALLLIFLFISNRIANPDSNKIGVFSTAVAFCVPSFQMYIHWSITWLFLWAALAGLYAFHFWASKILIKKFLGIFLLILALTTYPPTALFFFAVIAVLNTINRSRISKFHSDLVSALKLLIISGLGSILTAFVVLRLADISANKRTSVITFAEIPEKIIWVVSRPLVVGLRPFMIDSPSPKIALITTLPVILIIFFGIRKQSLNLRESIFLRAFWIILPLLLTLIPIIATSDNQIEFRLLPGYCWGVATLASFFLLEFIQNILGPRNIHSRLKTVATLVVPIVLIVVSVTSVNSHYRDLFGAPYEKKTSFLNSKISLCLDSGELKSVFILPPKKPFPSLPRLGVFSMTSDLASSWVPKPNVELLLVLRKIRVPVNYIETRPFNIKTLQTGCIIDLEDFRKSLI